MSLRRLAVAPDELRACRIPSGYSEELEGRMSYGGGFFVECESTANSVFEASHGAHWLRPSAKADEVLRRPDGRGCAHLLIGHRDRGIEHPGALLAGLRDPVEVELHRRSRSRLVTPSELR